MEKVWAALTIPEPVADWLAPAEIELKVGGRYELRFHDGADVMIGVITRIEPPRLLELTWRESGCPGSVLVFSLAAVGCRLTLTHAFPREVNDVRGFVSGWRQHLEGVAAACDGVQTA